MKHFMTPTRTLLVIAAALGMHGCGNDPLTSGVELSASMRGLLSASIDGTTTDSDIWRGEGRRLTLASPEAVERLAGQYKHLVMVSFQEGSRLRQLLKADGATLAYFPPDGARGGAALLGIGDDESVDMLAAAAHAGPPHACGRLQLLDLNVVQDVDTLTPPLYDEALVLEDVEAMLATPSADSIMTSIKELEALGTRHHATASGLATSAKVKDMFAAAGDGLPQLVIEEIDHSGDALKSNQKSVVARLSGATDDETTIVIGAHLDSINSGGDDEPAPGADDDASGVATIVEVMKALAASGTTFDRRIEFHAYAAEEVGLRGSGNIAQAYRESGRNVAAMLQLDMNAWSEDPAAQTIYLVTKDTNITLRRSLKDLLNTYLGGDFQEKDLPAGTSDHKSWHLRGFPAVFPFEDPDNFNKRLHSTSDTSAEATNTALSARFAKMVLAFLAHHAGLQSAAADADGKLASWRAATPKDLKLAVEPGQLEGTYAISVAAPTSVASIEVCVIAAAGGTGCTNDVVTAWLARTEGDRNFFSVDADTPLAAGSRLAVFGYDTGEKLVMQRSVRFESK